MRAKWLQLCLTLCNPVDYNQSGSSVHGTLQARRLLWWSCPPPGNLPNPGIETASAALAGRNAPPGKPLGCQGNSPRGSCVCSPEGGFPCRSAVKKVPAMRETGEMQLQSLGREETLEKETATPTSTLAWKIPWTEAPGGLQSMGSQRVGRDFQTKRQQQQFRSRDRQESRKL